MHVDDDRIRQHGPPRQGLSEVSSIRVSDDNSRGLVRVIDTFVARPRGAIGFVRRVWALSGARQRGCKWEQVRAFPHGSRLERAPIDSVEARADIGAACL